MESSERDFACNGCEQDPPTGSFDLHGGVMITEDLALQGELWFHSRALDVDGMTSVNQSMFLLAAQYWPTARFWLKAGIGLASLTTSSAGAGSENLDDGSALMAAIGYELMHSRGFGLDVQLKTGMGNYSQDAKAVAITALALGLNWY
jgi:hypothetical protein